MSRSTRRNCGRACKALVALLVVLAMLWVMGNRQNPALVSQQGWHELATTTSNGTLDPYPAVHEVVVEPLERSPLEVLIGYLPPPIGDLGNGEIEGEFDPNTGSIRICGELVKLQATLPPQLQGEFRRTLRHEYGHAFLSDYCAANGMDPFEPAFLEASQAGAQPDPDDFPKKLRPVVEAYLSAPTGVYGMPYFTSSFQEFFAESYARYVDGDNVPSEVRRFFGECVERPGEMARK